MQPKIVFLGTGGDSIVVGKQLRSAGGIIVQVEENQLHIDPGPGALARAKDYGVNIRANVAVLVSHNHLNHAGDINSVISAMTLGGLDPKGVLVLNKSAAEGTGELDRYLTDYHRRLIERSIVLEAGQRVGINEIEVKATRALHSDPTAVGFKLVTPKFVMGYTGDTGYSTSLAEDFRDVDLMVFNTVLPREQKEQGQLNADDVLRLLSQIKPKLAIITHFGIKMEESDVLNEARRIQRESQVQTVAAKDGMAINPVSYAVSLRQKTLNLF